jgi:hypothetical protein
MLFLPLQLASHAITATDKSVAIICTIHDEDMFVGLEVRCLSDCTEGVVELDENFGSHILYF